MSNCSNSGSINKYVIVEPSSSGVFSGLTVCGGSGIVTDKISGCTDSIDINGNIFYNNGDILSTSKLTIPIVSGGTFYGDGSNLTGISSVDSFATGGTYNNGFITISGSNDFNTFNIDVNDITDSYVSGATLDNSLLTLSLVGGKSDVVVDMTPIKFSGGSNNCVTDLYVTNIHGCSPITLMDDLIVSGNTTITEDLTVLGTIYGDGSNLTNLPKYISGGTNLGFGSDVFKDVTDDNLTFRRINGNPLNNNKLTTSVSGDTVILDIDEPNMTLWPLVVKGNTLISGGATFLSGLTFNISDLEYIIGESLYYANSRNVNIKSIHTVFDRIDVLVADISGNTSVVQGEPNLNPVKPQINLDEQVEITFVTVGAGQSTPEVSQTKVYDENIGVIGGEWDLTTTPNIDGDSTNDSFSGNKSIEFTSSIDGDYLILDATSDYDISDDNILTFYVKNKVRWPNRYYIDLSFLDSNDNINGNVVRLDNNRYGFSHINTSSWQVVSIPLGDFGMSSNLLRKIKLEVKTVRPVTSTLNLYVDLIRFQAGAPTTSPQSIWLSFVGDDEKVATATNNTEQLRLSGGTNITTSIPNNNTVVFDLDDDINLNSVTANVYYGDGSNLIGIADNYVVSGVYDPSTGVVTYTNVSGGTFGISGFTTGMTDSFTDNAYLDGNVIRFDNTIQGPNLYDVDLSPLLDIKVDKSDFDSHTGDTNNPHDTSFGNLTSTGHTHNVVDVIGLEDILNNKLDLTGGTISGDLVVNGSLSATTYYGDGSNLIGISSEDNYTLNSTLNGEILSFNTTSGITPYSVDLGPLISGKTDLTLFDSHTGDTSIHFTKGSINLSDLGSTGHTHTLGDIVDFNTYSGQTQQDINNKISGATNLSEVGVFKGKNNQNLEFKGLTSTGGTLNITSYNNTVDLSVNLPSFDDKFVSGGTYNTTNDNINFVGNSSETSFDVDLSDLINKVSGDTYVIDQNLGLDFKLTTVRNDGVNIVTDLSPLSSDVYIVSGVYEPSTGIVTYTNTSGGTFQVSGFTTGMTDSFTDNAYLDGNVIRFDNNLQGGDFYDVDLYPTLSGFSTTDYYVTGVTLDVNTLILSRNGGLPNLTADLSSLSPTGETIDRYVTGATLNGTILELSRNFGLSDVTVDLGTLDNSQVTGFTYNNSNKLTISQNGVSDLSVTINEFSGITSTGPISATTYYGDGSNLTGISTDDNYTSGSTLNGDILEFNTTSGISDYSVNLNPLISGKTDLNLFNSHTGDTNIHYTKDSINLSDLGSTGHTHTLGDITDFNSYSGSVQTILDTKIEGGTNIGGSNEIFGDVNGNNLEFRTLSGGSNTIISTIGDVIKVDVSVPVDTNTFVSGFTYNNNTFTITQNDGSSYSSTIDSVTGLTVNGTLIVDTISASTYTGFTLNDLDDVTTNVPNTPDNTYQGTLMYFDVVSNQWVSGDEYGSLGAVTIWGKKGTPGTIDKGCPLYITGFDDDIHEVELTNSTSANTMPVIGFAAEDLDDGGVYPIVTFGKVTGLDLTSGSTIINPFSETWEVNDVLYAAKSDGGLTKFRPTGTNTQIQRIAKVLKVGTIDGQLFIFNTARTAGLPNLTTDYLWVGNGNDTPQEVLRTDVGITTTGFTYNGNNTFTITDDNGGLISTTINEVSGLTINGDLVVTGDTTLGPLTASSITSNSTIDVFNGHINLRDNSYFLQGRDGINGNVSLIGVDSQDRVFIGNSGYDTYVDSDTIVDGVLSAQTFVLTTPPTLNNLGTDILLRNKTTGEIEYRSVSGITPDTFVTGGSLSGDNLILEKSNGVDVNPIDLSGLVSGKTNNTDFTSHTSDTSIHFTKDSINLSDLGNTGHTHNISEINGLQDSLNDKLDLTGGTINGSLSATTYYGDGSNLTGIVDNYVSGATLNGNSIELNRTDSTNIISISGGTNTLITEISTNNFKIDVTGGSGEVNTASNLSGGVGLFFGKSNEDLQFKSLTSTGGTVTITTDNNTVNLESSGGSSDDTPGKIFSWFMNVT